MTIGSQLKQTLASLKGAKATLDLYQTQSTSPQDQEILESNGEKVEQIIGVLEKRIREIEFEEPQYKGF